jgi:catechol 2,3-dioxygenase-like lactoylglutathione lyase family enzyme
MIQQLALIALVVKDYDEAISFYTTKLHFKLLEDTPMTATKRWVVVAPPGSHCGILLAQATDEHQQSRIGNQTGGRVFLFLHTDDFQRDYQNLITQEIKIVRKPTWNPTAQLPFLLTSMEICGTLFNRHVYDEQVIPRLPYNS